MNKVKIYVWSWCPYCLRALKLLDSKKISYEKIVVDDDADLLNKIRSQTGQSSVPQIFIQEKFIGGCDDLFSLENSGKLDEIVNS